MSPGLILFQNIQLHHNSKMVVIGMISLSTLWVYLSLIINMGLRRNANSMIITNMATINARERVAIEVCVQQVPKHNY